MSHKTKLLFILLLSICYNIQAQDYKKYTYYSELASYHKEPDSINYYREKALIYVKEPFCKDRFYLLRKNSKERDTVKFLENSMILLTKGYPKEWILEKIKDDKFLSDEQKKKIETTEYLVYDLDVPFIAEFSELLGADQFLRRYYSEDRDCLEKYALKADSISHVRLKKYIEENGIPDIRRLGYYQPILFVLISHIIATESCADSWYGYYRPKLIKMAEEGKFFYDMIASYDDRYHWAFENQQIYGTIHMLITDDNQPSEKQKRKIIAPIKDIENLDKRRSELGLPPFYLYAKYLNIIIPKGYTPQK
jgi:hypothetical protein